MVYFLEIKDEKTKAYGPTYNLRDNLNLKWWNMPSI